MTKRFGALLMATSAMNGAMLDSTFLVFFKLKIAKTYDAMLSTPLGVGRSSSFWSLPPVRRTQTTETASVKVGASTLRGRCSASGFRSASCRPARWKAFRSRRSCESAQWIFTSRAGSATRNQPRCA